jgi:hypothetical protein
MSELAQPVFVALSLAIVISLMFLCFRLVTNKNFNSLIAKLWSRTEKNTFLSAIAASLFYNGIGACIVFSICALFDWTIHPATILIILGSVVIQTVLKLKDQRTETVK